LWGIGWWKTGVRATSQNDHQRKHASHHPKTFNTPQSQKQSTAKQPPHYHQNIRPSSHYQTATEPTSNHQMVECAAKLALMLAQTQLFFRATKFG